MILKIGLLCAGLYAGLSHAEPRVVIDDVGQQVTMSQSPKRIVTLSPHGAELIDSAGGAVWLVGVAARSDFPESVKEIPVVADYSGINMERMLALKPDLIVAWGSGHHKQLNQIKDTPVFISNPKTLTQIIDNIEKLSVLMGTQVEKTLDAYRTRLENLHNQYQSRVQKKVFYQVAHAPMYTLGQGNLQNEILRLCGAKNVFEQSSMTAPQTSIEQVIQLHPEVIVLAMDKTSAIRAKKTWQKYLPEAQRIWVNPDELNRPTLRAIEETERLCEKINAGAAAISSSVAR